MTGLRPRWLRACNRPAWNSLRVPDDADWRATAEKITEAHEERVARLAERPAGPHAARERQVLDRGYADVISTLAYDASATPVFDRPRG